jgi:hypothetical protein
MDRKDAMNQNDDGLAWIGVGIRLTTKEENRLFSFFPKELECIFRKADD